MDLAPDTPRQFSCPCERGREVLRESGLRITPQRAAILELFTGDDGHWTPQRIVTALENSRMSLSQATVYNTLETFEEIGLLSRFTTPDGHTVFDRNVRDHQHAVCTACDTIYDVELPDDALAALFEQSSTIIEFEISGASMWLRGLCQSCR